MQNQNADQALMILHRNVSKKASRHSPGYTIIFGAHEHFHVVAKDREWKPI